MTYPLIVPERVTKIPSPPFDFLHEKAENLRNNGYDVIDLSQGIPYLPLLKVVIDTALCALNDRTTYEYSAGSGLLSLRDALARNLFKYNKVRTDPETEVMITAGANQAFLLALLTLLNPGDIVLLPSPYFIGHAMAVQTVGAVPLEVPLSEDRGFQLCLDDIAPFLRMGPRLLVIVSPNNPTGAVYDPDELYKVIDSAIEHNCVVLTDETYQHFVCDGKQHFSARSVEEFRAHVLTIGSFSKIFNLAGWRLGYLIGPSAFIKHALKLQEPMIICPPVLSQKVVTAILQEYGLVLPHYIQEIAERRQLTVSRLREIDSVSWVPTDGAYFAFVRIKSSLTSFELALKILESVHLVITPGSTFGQAGEGFLRLSYASASLDTLQKAYDRLKHFFTTI